MSEEVMTDNVEPTEVETVETEAPESVEAEAPVEEIVEEVESPEDKISRLEKEREVDNRKIARQKAAAASLHKKIEELKTAQQAPKPATQSDAPKEDDFDTYEQFDNARVEFKAQQIADAKLSEYQQGQIAQLEQQKILEQQQSFQKSEAEFRAVNPSYDDAREEFEQYVGSTEISGVVQEAIISQAHREGNIAEVINYFGANGGERLGELDAIVSMTPVEAAVEIYKIQQSIKSEPTPTKTKAKLPKPHNPIKGSGAKASKSVAKMSPRELVDRFG